MTQAPEADLEITYVQVGLIDANPWNPNRQSDIVARATRESIGEYGFVEPVLLRPHPHQPGRYEIVNGEHRVKEAIELGLDAVPGVVRDLTDEQAKKLTVILNETTGEADVVLLGKLLADLSDLDSFRIGLPYTEGELQHLLALGNEVWDTDLTGLDADLPADDGDDGEATGQEYVVTVPDELADDFQAWLAEAGKRFGTAGTSDTIIEAVKRAAA